MNEWQVVLADAATSTPIETVFRAYWDPAKTPSEDVAKAAAIQHNYFQEKDRDGQPLNPVLPISAQPVAA
jgi:hypothetical protein